MRLVEIALTICKEPLPPRVELLLAEARKRIESLEEQSRASIPAFVPSDYELVYRALVAIRAEKLATGRRFCEWGSGIGAITCLAVLAGYDAYGIEIESELVNIAEELALDQSVAAQFAGGSFIPEGIEPRVDSVSDVTWLSTSGSDGYGQLELDPDDFDLIFAYPWPGEEQVIFDIFLECAAVGTLLLTYHGLEGLRLHRKVRR